MPIQKSEAILLRRQDLRETSLALVFYTKDFGKIRGIARGVRGFARQCGGAGLEIFARDEIVFYERKKSDFFTISQIDLLEFFDPVRGDLERLAHATYILELLDSVTALTDPNTEVYELLLNSLKLMSGGSSAKRVTRIFEIKLLHLLGLMPSLEGCVICSGPVGAKAVFSLRHGGLVCEGCSKEAPGQTILAGTAKFIEHIRALPFDKVSRIKVASEVGRELEVLLRKFLDYHIERKLKTVEFLKDIEK